MSKNKEIDLSVFDEEVSKEIDLSVFDNEVDVKSDFNNTDKESQYIPEDLKDTIIGSGTGALVGKTAKEVINRSGEGLKSSAEKMAFKTIGAGKTPTGRKFIKSTLPQEIAKEVMDDYDLPSGSSLFTPKDIGREILDENLFDYKNASELSEVRRKDLETLLNQVQGTKDPKELSGKFRQKVEQEFPYKEQTVGSKAEKGIQSFEERMESSGVPRTASELEEMKRISREGIDYGPGTKKIKQSLEKIESNVFKEASEDLVQEFGDDKLLNEFRSAKTKAGKMKVIKDIITEDMVADYAKTAGLDFQDAMAIAYSKPEIMVARRALKSTNLKKGLAKSMDVASKLLKKLGDTKIVEKLPIIGSVLGGSLAYSTAKASGLSDIESIGSAIAEEGTDLIPGVGLAKMALGPSEIGQQEEIQPQEQAQQKLKESIQEKSIKGEELSSQEKLYLDYKNKEAPTFNEDDYSQQRLRQNLKKEPNSVQKKEQDLNRMQSFLNQYQDLNKAGTNAFIGEAQKFIDTKDENEKARIKYNLEQQPAFRQLIKKMEKNNVE